MSKTATAPVTGEKVKLKLFKDNGAYKDDVYVAVNGTAYLIKRGVEVEVPASVAHVLENSERQRAKAEAVMSDVSSQFEYE